MPTMTRIGRKGAGLLALAAVLAVLSTHFVPQRGSAEAQTPNDRPPVDARDANFMAMRASAKEMASTTAARSAEALSSFQGAALRDAASYRFEAHRHGAFMEMSIARAGGTYSIAMLLDSLTTAHLEEGHAPDERGVASYSYSPRDGKPGFTLCGVGCSLVWLLDGRTVSVDHHVDPSIWMLTLRIPEIPDRGIVCQDSQAQDLADPPCHSFDNLIEDTSIQIKDQPMARPAQDDRIIFSKITIYTPFGLGRSVLDQIMTASGRDEARP